MKMCPSKELMYTHIHKVLVCIRMYIHVNVSAVLKYMRNSQKYP